MPVDHHSPWYTPCAVLQSAGIPCCVWFDHAIVHHSRRPMGLSSTEILVPDIDGAAGVLIAHGWSDIPRSTPKGAWRIANAEVTLPQRRLAPPPGSDTRGVVVLLCDRQWGYDVTRHHARYPSSDPEWIFPPLGAIIDAFITQLLDDRHVEADLHARGGLAAMYLGSVYETSKRQDAGFAARVRDPALVEQLAFENRQFHIDAAYGLPVFADQYVERARRVRRELSEGKRGLRDAVDEYEAWVAEMGLKEGEDE